MSGLPCNERMDCTQCPKAVENLKGQKLLAQGNALGYYGRKLDAL